MITPLFIITQAQLDWVKRGWGG